MYCIIKKIKNEHGITVPVIVLDNHDEILEFESLEDAEVMRDTFQKNSDSGHEYIVKKI
jgi:hypothetical protein